MNNNFSPSIISVSQLNYYIKSILESDSKLRYVFVTGEISNLTDHYSSGHIYLSLKDEKAIIKAVMFSFSAKNLKFRPQNGMKVIVRGRVSLYEPSGQYQLYIEDMQPDGVGSLTIAFEQLKKKLGAEGLFDPEFKKQLPEFPKKIAVVTSPTGAALQDIRNILSRRWPYSEVEVVPVLVQGDTAARMLTDAISDLSDKNSADVIIIGRGGGSIEDLWAFNNEGLARAIFACKIPVISAVGHETDYTICDFVADMRAPTPSAAAELATPDRFAQIDLLSKQRQYLVALGEKLLRTKESELSAFDTVLKAYDPRIEFELKVQQLENQKERLTGVSDNILSDKSMRLEKLKTQLFSLNPAEILKRGYAVVSLDDKTVSSVKFIKKGENIKVTLSDGDFSATVN